MFHSLVSLLPISPSALLPFSLLYPHTIVIGGVESLNFQKKILPWANIELDQELSRTVVRTRKRQSLILVATLIDKIPNLAGTVICACVRACVRRACMDE